jgi:hypothetical protein
MHCCCGFWLKLREHFSNKYAVPVASMVKNPGKQQHISSSQQPVHAHMWNKRKRDVAEQVSEEEEEEGHQDLAAQLGATHVSDQGERAWKKYEDWGKTTGSGKEYDIFWSLEKIRQYEVQKKAGGWINYEAKEMDQEKWAEWVKCYDGGWKGEVEDDVAAEKDDAATAGSSTDDKKKQVWTPAQWKKYCEVWEEWQVEKGNEMAP